MKRRNFLQQLSAAGLGLLAAPTLLRIPGASAGAASSTQASAESLPLSAHDLALLDAIEHAAFRFFWEQAPAATGQVKDRAHAHGQDRYMASSIAATGFGLTAMCVGQARGYAPTAAIASRVRTTLRFVHDQVEGIRGWYFHFVDMQSGQRLWKCELSSIDTALLLAGVLCCRTAFARDAEIRDLATRIYERVDFPWMMAGGHTLSMGYKPESGFLDARWDHYCELMILYLLGIGSPTHPIAPDTWEAFRRPQVEYFGQRYISGAPSLFTHQYSHAWVDFRGQHDAHADYFANSVAATRAHRAFCASLGYARDLWGVSASDTRAGYRGWGGPPKDGPVDGTVVPCAAGGSLVFCPRETLDVLHRARSIPGTWCRYGFVDAFDPKTGWLNPDVIGIDVGITMLMAENLRSGIVWKLFMANPEIPLAMRRVGFTR